MHRVALSGFSIDAMSLEALAELEKQLGLFPRLMIVAYPISLAHSHPAGPYQIERGVR